MVTRQIEIDYLNETRVIWFGGQYYLLTVTGDSVIAWYKLPEESTRHWE